MTPIFDAQWIRTDYQWMPRMAWLMVNDRELLRRRMLNLPELTATADPVLIQKILHDIVSELRPDLDGGTILAIRMLLVPRRWEFLYSHRSLPELDESMEPPRQVLVPIEQLFANTPDIPMDIVPGAKGG